MWRKTKKWGACLRQDAWPILRKLRPVWATFLGNKRKVIGASTVAAALLLSSLCLVNRLWAAKPAPPPLPSYSFKLLGHLGSGYSKPYGINNRGDVVGISAMDPVTDGRGPDRAFLWTAATQTMIDLNTLVDPGDPNVAWTLVRATDINDSGQICGMAVLRDASGATLQEEPFRFTPATADGPSILEILGTPDDGFTNTDAKGINDHGDVTGRASLADGGHAVIWSPTKGTVVIPRLEGHDTSASDINNNFQVTGLSGGFLYRAWRWSETDGLQNLGLLRGSGFSAGNGINDSGQVGGASTVGQSQHAFRYTDGVGMVDLGTLGGSFSNGGEINKYGDVVGVSTLKGRVTVIHLFLYTDSLGMVDLEKLIVDLPPALSGKLDAPAINDMGEVCGFADGAGAFLLTPRL
jgi:probable HAF family extracellular repeat protein